MLQCGITASGFSRDAADDQLKREFGPTARGSLHEVGQFWRHLQFLPKLLWIIRKTHPILNSTYSPFYFKQQSNTELKTHNNIIALTTIIKVLI